MIKCILIDDEINALEVLEWQLKKYCPDVNILGWCHSVDEAEQMLKKEMPDLVFLDIEMPGRNGFELLRLYDELPFEVIFTTAYNQFALHAIKCAALDYLLKPIATEELLQAIHRYKNKYQKTQAAQWKIAEEQLLQTNSTGKIALNTSDGLLFITPDSIIRCEAISNYTQMILQNGQKHVVSKTLKDVEEILQGFLFYRVHHSHLVNLHHIVKLVKQDGGYIITTDGEHITVARNRKDGLLEKFSRI